MSYTRPTQEQIYNTIKADLLSRFPTLDPTLANSLALGLVSVIAGGQSGLYDYLDWILKQMFPDTATTEIIERWANIFGLERDAAAKSTGSITATASVLGTIVPVGSELQTVGGTRIKLTQALDFTASSPQTATAEAVEFGPNGNLATSTVVTFVQSWAGVDDNATVDSPGMIGGRDRQTDESLQEEVLNRLAEPPKGGALYDYDRWAKEATDVTRAFIRNWENGPAFGDSVTLGEILVYFAMDNTYSDGIPSAGDVSTVDAYIQERKPGGAKVSVVGPTASPVPFNVTIVPNNATTQAATSESLKNAIIEDGQPGGTITLNKFQEAMAAVPGLTDWTINSPTAGVSAGTGTLHTLGTVTFS